MLIAITRAVSPTINSCQLTHLKRQPIDVALAERQHQAYEDALGRLGCSIVRLSAAPELPDAVFVEDTCVVLDELAVIANPGAVSRRPETLAAAETLLAYRRLEYITSPGTLDGGDVVRLGKRIFVGRTERTNQAGINQLRTLTAPYGYAVTAVEVNGCLHLKSAVTQVADETILVNRSWLDMRAFDNLDLIDVDGAEPSAANALLVSGTVVYPTAYTRTAARLRERGIKLVTIDNSELAKAEGGVTCSSVIFPAR